jgi:hypothetical protein
MFVYKRLMGSDPALDVVCRQRSKHLTEGIEIDNYQSQRDRPY